MGDWIKPGVAEDLLADEVAVHFLRLRELLVRGDENLKAHRLLECVPYWAYEHPAVVKARIEQGSMVLHALKPEEYGKYYATNVHERPFEQQYGIAARDAHQYIHRVQFLLQHLEPDSRVLDLSANDGWMGECIGGFGHRTDCLDLNPDCVARARNRPGVTRAEQGDLLQTIDGHYTEEFYDAVVLFEVIEHLVDPVAGIKAAALRVNENGALFVSTPLAAVERLDLPTWAHIEPKGHLHSITPSQFHDMLEEVGSVECMDTGPERVMVAKVVL